MGKMEKLTEQQQFERRKRIPQRTQKTLEQMIRRRFEELSGQPPYPRQNRDYTAQDH